MPDTAPSRHSTLWKEDGNIVIQAEQTLFKLHRSILSGESEVFAGMFTAVSAGKDGTEDVPLRLQQVSATTLADLLAIVYTAWTVDESTTTLEGYMDVLRLAHKFQFANIHRELLPQRLSIEQRLHLAITSCGADDWGEIAFNELVLASDIEEATDDSTLLPAALWSRIFRTRMRIVRLRSRATHVCKEHQVGLTRLWQSDVTMSSLQSKRCGKLWSTLQICEINAIHAQEVKLIQEAWIAGKYLASS